MPIKLVRNNQTKETSTSDPEIIILEKICIELESKKCKSTELQITNLEIPSELFQRLANALARNNTIKTLSLVDMNFTEENLDSLAKAFENNSAITKFAITLTNGSMPSVAKLLEKSRSLESLELKLANVDVYDLAAVNQFLKSNPGITTLILDKSVLTDDFLKEIAEAAEKNHNNSKATAQKTTSWDAGPTSLAANDLNSVEVTSNRKRARIQDSEDGLSIIRVISPAEPQKARIKGPNGEDSALGDDEKILKPIPTTPQSSQEPDINLGDVDLEKRLPYDAYLDDQELMGDRGTPFLSREYFGETPDYACLKSIAFTEETKKASKNLASQMDDDNTPASSNQSSHHTQNQQPQDDQLTPLLGVAIDPNDITQASGHEGNAHTDPQEEPLASPLLAVAIDHNSSDNVI